MSGSFYSKEKRVCALQTELKTSNYITGGLRGDFFPPVAPRRIDRTG